MKGITAVTGIIAVMGITAVLTWACIVSGCVAGSAVSHEDDPAAVKRDQGPDLCRDGTAPPCTPRS
jgi:hypothetical protein